MSSSVRHLDKYHEEYKIKVKHFEASNCQTYGDITLRLKVGRKKGRCSLAE